MYRAKIQEREVHRYVRVCASFFFLRRFLLSVVFVLFFFANSGRTADSNVASSMGTMHSTSKQALHKQRLALWNI